MILMKYHDAMSKFKYYYAKTGKLFKLKIYIHISNKTQVYETDWYKILFLQWFMYGTIQ